PAGTVTSFNVGNYGTGRITSGPDGNLWVNASNGTSLAIGRVTPQQVVTWFPVAGPGVEGGITSGPHGHPRFTHLSPPRTSSSKKIGSITPSGTITQCAVPGGAEMSSIVSGPDGNLWLIGGFGVARATTAGTITEFPIATLWRTTDMARGPDSNLWFTERDV